MTILQYRDDFLMSFCVMWLKLMYECDDGLGWIGLGQ